MEREATINKTTTNLTEIAKEITKSKHIAYTNTPKGLTDAYFDAVNVEQATTAEIFLKAGGFNAWFTYYLAKRFSNNTSHCDGQAACKQLIKSLDELSTADRESVAEEVSAILPIDTVRKFQQVFEKVTQPIQNDATISPRKRRRVADYRAGPSAAPVLSPATSPMSSTWATGELPSSNRFDLGNPIVRSVVDVFPTFLASAIAKYRVSNEELSWAAKVTMSFPNITTFGNTFGSMMTLEILSNKVERIVSLLCDAHVESTDTYRYVVLSNGLKILPSPDVILRGGKRDMILEVFGHDLDIAIKASPAYKEEAELGKPLTECVTITMSARPDEGAFVNLTLDEKEGVRVKGKLYN